MHIDSYTFGRIVIDGKTCTSDVIIFPERVVSPWWRRQGHLLQMEDLVEVIRERPEVLIVGKGFSGLMKVPQELMDELGSMGIKVIAEKTTRAVTIFNDYRGSHVVAALHLTC
ncbi:hypothetical protein MNBD_NITROSPIRAE03-1560 [hydrothermal vent metagenome]|uniref:Uncharacterized protein n=1 Tax=hydrothermal vent metagenome TaxID=652676 RepID=A0A3B1CQH4_9ZZZZ